MPKVAKISGLVLLPILLWAAFILFHKESLDVGLLDFYRPRQIIPLEQDATVFLNGLAAPSGKDVVEHGLWIARIYAEAGTDSARAKQKIETVGEIGLIFSTDGLDCWIHGQAEGAMQQPCASAKEVRRLVESNSLLLDRYRAMATLSFSGSASHNLLLFLNLNRLLAAQVLLESRAGKPEAAFQRWRSNFAFLNRAAGSPSSWIERAVVLLSYGLAQTTLEELLHAYPDLAVKHRVELLELLDGDIELWRVDEALRGDYAMLERDFFTDFTQWYFDAGFVRNRIYRGDQVLLSIVMKTKAKSLRSELKSVWQQHSRPIEKVADYALNPLSAVVANSLLGGRPKFGELVIHMWEKAAYNRLLVLRVQATRPSGRMNVADWVANSPAELHNPFNEQPMVGASKQRVLWFSSDGCRTARQARLPGGRFFTQEEIAALHSSYPEHCS